MNDKPPPPEPSAEQPSNHPTESERAVEPRSDSLPASSSGAQTPSMSDRLEGLNAKDLLLVLVPMTAVLWMMGRRFWCKCGSWSPWSWEVVSMHNSQHLIDAYSFTHFLHGLLFFGFFWLFRGRWTKRQRLLAALVIEAGWEILENSPIIIDRYRATTISLDYYGDSIANSIADVGSCLLGYLIASRVKWQVSVLLILVIEISLLATIRDSLLLNVIMLTFPSDAILQWQSGG